MARGPYRLALTRASITLPDGRKIENAYLTVRDGIATAKVGTTVAAEAPATEVSRSSRRAGTITTPDGIWSFTRDCGCGSR